MPVGSSQISIKYPLMRVFFIALLLFGSTVVFVARVKAAELNIAVASNFKSTLQKLALDFKGKTGYDLRISAGSSGKLYAQIQHGAPFDVFLSADEKRADLLLEKNIAVRESAFIYASGKLVLLSNVKVTGDCRDVLTSEQLHKLAIANPKIAPYGLAARQVLENMGLWNRLRPRLVMGENIAQTLQFVSTKNAQAGFIAESLLQVANVKPDKAGSGSCLWHVPTDMYSPIRQKMVVMNKVKDKSSVQSFVRYIRSTRAKEIIRASGYNVDR